MVQLDRRKQRRIGQLDLGAPDRIGLSISMAQTLVERTDASSIRQPAMVPGYRLRHELPERGVDASGRVQHKGRARCGVVDSRTTL
jgi:hypothetical protein